MSIEDIEVMVPGSEGPDDGEAISPYPKFNGQTLDEISSTDEGLLYLDWLIGWLDSQELYGKYIDFHESLRRYLTRPVISRAVDDAIANKESQQSDDVPGAWHPPGVNKPWWEK